MTAGNQAALTAEDWLLGVDRGVPPPPRPSRLEVQLTRALAPLSSRPCADVPEAWGSQAVPTLPC